MTETMLLIGDSIRLDYQTYVSERLAGVASVGGPVENGGDSRRLLENLDDWVTRQAPDIVHLNCGLHDIKRERGTTGCAVPVEEYERNLRAIFLHLRAATTATLVWASTTPVIDARHAAHKAFDRRLDDVLVYNAAAARAAADCGVAVNDLYGVIAAAGADALLLPDGVHFTREGSRLLGKAVAGFLVEHCIRAARK